MTGWFAICWKPGTLVKTEPGAEIASRSIGPGFSPAEFGPWGPLAVEAAGAAAGAPAPVLPAASFAPASPVPVLPLPPKDGGTPLEFAAIRPGLSVRA